ncbi:hypothetical protein [Kitasatospora sp. NPDC058190]|uniref:hypothetical protein n=1 Tax=Kitasatospora sp. NPDC058190 TaxID=3346371 RepID=UPI0036DF9CAA
MTVNDVARSLPDPDVLRDHCRALAMLDAILGPGQSSRYHSYDARWSQTEEMASMANGSGDEYSIVFAPAGVYVRGHPDSFRVRPVLSGRPDTLHPHDAAARSTDRHDQAADTGNGTVPTRSRGGNSQAQPSVVGVGRDVVRG